MEKLVGRILAGIVGIYLAVNSITGVYLYQGSFFGMNLALWQTYILVGSFLGLLNFFVKPILNVVTLPLRLLTVGLFGFLINVFLVWIVDILFAEFEVHGLIPLFLTTLIVWGLGLVFRIII